MKIAHGISIPGFIMTCTLRVHLAAKTLVVRILRHSEHLQSRSFTHWAGFHDRHQLTRVHLRRGCPLLQLPYRIAWRPLLGANVSGHPGLDGALHGLGAPTHELEEEGCLPSPHVHGHGRAVHDGRQHDDHDTEHC